MLFERLRAETQDLHREIERRLPIFNSDFTLGSYKHLLSRYVGFYVPVEEKLTLLRHRGLAVYAETRSKCPLLCMDLERLDVAGNEIAAIQRCEAVPELESVSQGIGCMYVLEGSTLGGQIISRHLKETLAITPETGGAFFASYGPELGNRWKEFREAVCQDERSLTQADQIVAAARDTFQCFNDWLMAGSAA